MFGRWLLRRAARKYATRLPHQLVTDYGHKEHYTYRQLQHSIKAARLNPRYTILALARYMPRPEFNSLRIGLDDLSLGYSDARVLFIEAEPVNAASHDGERPPNINNYA